LVHILRLEELQIIMTQSPESESDTFSALSNLSKLIILSIQLRFSVKSPFPFLSILDVLPQLEKLNIFRFSFQLCEIDTKFFLQGLGEIQKSKSSRIQDQEWSLQEVSQMKFPDLKDLNLISTNSNTRRRTFYSFFEKNVELQALELELKHWHIHELSARETPLELLAQLRYFKLKPTHLYGALSHDRRIPFLPKIISKMLNLETLELKLSSVNPHLLINILHILKL